MDAATEIINFAASVIAIDLIVDHPASEADRDEMILNLVAFGPALCERD